jgi:pyruvate-formate lyase-activating enzyme
MVYGALTAFLERDRLPPSGVVLTTVLSGGCPLSCPFCIVNQRDERRQQSYVTAHHLTGVLGALERRGLLGGVAIVGDEPLQPQSWPTVEKFLCAANNAGVQSAVITSGYNLVDYVDHLKPLTQTKFVVSIDAVGSEHDKIRRTPGAFARISEGLELATSYPDLRERLSIATILMPGNLSAISEIIDFTARLKIPQLLLSPLLTSSRTTPLAVHPRIMRDAWTELPTLLKRANSVGVKLRISDEFGVLGQWNDKLASAEIDIVSPSEPARLIRIDAAGRLETLATMQAGTTTGLHLPTDINEMDAFVATLAERCFDAVAVAA